MSMRGTNCCPGIISVLFMAKRSPLSTYFLEHSLRTAARTKCSLPGEELKRRSAPCRSGRLFHGGFKILTNSLFLFQMPFPFTNYIHIPEGSDLSCDILNRCIEFL